MEELKFKSIEELKENGFKGFVPFVELLEDDLKTPPKKEGIYMVLYGKKERPSFLPTGTGGFFKGKDPNVSLDTLNQEWVNDTPVIYIGKATELKARLSQYLKFGKGKNIGHYGGRYIWQIENAMKDLIICWKPIAESRSVEKGLISNFKKIYGDRPFANLVG